MLQTIMKIKQLHSYNEELQKRVHITTTVGMNAGLVEVSVGKYTVIGEISVK